jgi:hypothetical protein
LHRWQLDALIASLGPHATDFDLDAWVMALSKLADERLLVLDRKTLWPWVQAELKAECPAPRPRGGERGHRAEPREAVQPAPGGDSEHYADGRGVMRMAAQISQREARRLRRRVAELEAEVEAIWNEWLPEYMPGQRIATEPNTTSDARTAIQTARKLRHRVIAVVDGTNIAFYAKRMV